ncbi:hypothetical protein [Pseudoduganella sp. OTU4001]|uniref:hypothetical protein n=1 Tax=Pseudoduganella sp. OTU4001 TaxID=3043854 RepID=UPI00313C11CC
MQKTVDRQALQDGRCTSPTISCSNQNANYDVAMKRENGIEPFTGGETAAATYVAGGGILRVVKSLWGAVFGSAAGAGATTTGAESALQAARLRMQLSAEETAGARLPGQLAGYTKHGLNQAISRDGVGVAPHAILDAFKNPLSISGQSGGRFMMTGKDAVIVVNSEGKVITTWATNSSGVRVP